MIKKTYGKQRISFSDTALKLQDQNEYILNDLTNLQEDKCFKESEPKERVFITATDDSTATKLKIQKQKFIADFFKNIESLSNTDKKRRVKENEQLFLDLGQKSFNSYTCPDCKMSYNQGTAEDETLHAKYHKAAIGGIAYTNYKNQIFLQQYPEDNGSRVVMLTFNQSNPFEKKKMNEKKLEQCKIFLYITGNKKVVGCAVAEIIPQAYRVIDDDDNGITENSERIQIGMASDGSAIFCCTKPVRAVCGISRMWVLKKLRRRGIATRLLNNIRTHFLFGYTLEPSDLAFSQPTGDGKAFASHYTNSREFLVYVEQ
ncbi:2392_t:CDS:2 [Diversispora eburnea]|uniref:2392_t:CDS:1 n=1 Tax=Diversispora eburnea TaxID=1213867 RepID=A0A9N8WK32_9GLOM|nr:2392_t:CDS:2 [Diversispora eburnea]